MFERLMLHGAALAQKAALARRAELAESLRGDSPDGVEVGEEAAGIVLSGRGLRRRLALEPELRWLFAVRRR